MRGHNYTIETKQRANIMSERKRKWFCLNHLGNMQYVGEFKTYEEADEALQFDCVWLIPEEEAKVWLEQLTELLK